MTGHRQARPAARRLRRTVTGMDALTTLLDRRDGATDTHRVVVVLPGGGMRATWQIGALAELERRGLTAQVDAFVGSSAGAANACYTATGQAREAVQVYTDHLTGSRFIRPWRPDRVMDIDWLVDEIMAERVALDHHRLACGPDVRLVVTDLQTGAPRVYDQTTPDVLQVLRASMALPLLYGRAPALPDGGRGMDGGLVQPFPFDAALDLRPSHLLVLCPQPPGRRFQRPGVLPAALLDAWCHWRSPTAGVAARRSLHWRFDRGMRRCEADMVMGVPCTTVFASPEASAASRTTRDRQALREVADLGAADVTAAIRAATERRT